MNEARNLFLSAVSKVRYRVFFLWFVGPCGPFVGPCGPFVGPCGPFYICTFLYESDIKTYFFILICYIGKCSGNIFYIEIITGQILNCCDIKIPNQRILFVQTNNILKSLGSILVDWKKYELQTLSTYY